MRRALGKGLSQLIAEQFEPAPSDVALDDILPNREQPRTHFEDEALAELADSIKAHGVLQPIAVRPAAGGKFELIAGERRWRAARIAGLSRIPVVVREADDRSSLEMALIENIQREDIGPLECARAYRRLIDEFGLTQESVAERVGKSRAAIANTVRLLRLPARIQKGLEAGQISEGHARALLALPTEAHQLAVYDQILARGMSVRDVENVVQAAPKRPAAKPAKASPQDPHVHALEEAISAYFAAPAKIQRTPKGGQLTIEFYSDDDLERLLEVLGIRL